MLRFTYRSNAYFTVFPSDLESIETFGLKHARLRPNSPFWDDQIAAVSCISVTYSASTALLRLHPLPYHQAADESQNKRIPSSRFPGKLIGLRL